MSIEELKIEIAKKVFEINDENLLSELDILLNSNEKVVLEDLPKLFKREFKEVKTSRRR